MNGTPDRDLDLRGVAIGAIAIAVMIVLACVAAWWAWSGWMPAGSRDGPDAPADFGVAGARLESAPRLERNAYFKEKDRLLHSWQWVDRNAGIARIPIEDAMDLLARQARPAPKPGPERKR
jgi:hypothetical protein